MSFTPSDQPYEYRFRALAAALNEQGSAVLHQGPDRRFDIAEGVYAPWSPGGMLGQNEEAAFAAPIARLFRDAFDRCTGEKSRVSFEFDLTNDTRRQFFAAVMQPDATGVLTVVSEVTETHAAEQALASLLREVSHRSKNLLAIVQSVAMQTAVHSGGVQDFLDKFRGRLHALSGTQDLVTESNWRGTHLQSLVTAQLVRVVPSALGQLRMTGENPVLGPNASLHIGLAIHELGANAMRHGALSKANPGQVWIDASLAPNASGLPDLVIEWRESGLHTGSTTALPRFGTLVLERIVPLSVGGSADYTIDDDTVSYRLRVPADQYET